MTVEIFVAILFLDMENKMDGSPIHEAKELEPITLEQTCVVGNVQFKNYTVENSEGNIRGHEAIESIVHAAEKGVKVAFIISTDTDSKFVDDLKTELAKLEDKKRENVVWDFREDHGYSEARREAIMFARSKYKESMPRAFIMQEIEKDISGDYEEFLNSLSNGKALVMMDRGINRIGTGDVREEANSVTANIPVEQLAGERSQDRDMALQEKGFGITKEKHLWDRLNGTRIIRNEEMEFTVGETKVKINPADLILLNYRYSDGYTEFDRKNDIDKYSAAVYNMIPILEALDEETLSSVLVKYDHPEAQRKKEEGDPGYREKRHWQKIDLIAINFDMVSNISEWKEEGKWPQILLDALNGDLVLDIKHFKENPSLTEILSKSRNYQPPKR